MVDLVGPAIRIIVQPDDLPDHRNNIIDAQNAIGQPHGIALLFSFFLCLQIRQPLPHLPSSHLGQIVAFEVKKHVLDQFFGRIGGSQIAGSESLVNFDQRLCLVMRRILFQGFFDKINGSVIHVLENLFDRLVIVYTKSPQQSRGGHAALAVDLYADKTGMGGFEFQPRSPVRDDLGSEVILAADNVG